MKPKVLIVDDRVENLVALEKVLQDIDVEFCRAISGNDAIAQTLEHEFALILIDVQMPEMDGYETVEILRHEKKNRHIPVIFMSAIYSDDYYKIKGIETGAVDFLSKPINPEILNGKVSFFIDYYKQRKQVEETAEILKEQNRKLEKSESELKKLNSAKDKILSIIGHDLRGPLNGIIGYSDLLLSDISHFNPNELESHITSIKRISTGLYTLLKNLLDWARLQTGDFDFNPEKVCINEAIKEVVELFEGNFEHKQIQFSTEIEESHCVWVDRNMMHTIFRNLVSNSIKFCNEGGKISILSKNNGDVIEMCVIDNGVGLSEIKINEILNFTHIQSTSGTNEESGTGLGLSLCMEMIKKNNGTLSIESEPGVKTEFRFVLPVSN